jgi:hypothetical protein
MCTTLRILIKNIQLPEPSVQDIPCLNFISSKFLGTDSTGLTSTGFNALTSFRIASGAGSGVTKANRGVLS